MNIISMMDEIHFVANPMIGESSLPHFALSSDDAANFMRVRAFDQLDRAFDGYIGRRSQQEMHVFGHENEGMQLEAPFTAIPIKGMKEDSHVFLNDEQFSAMVRGEGYKICSVWGDESSRLQGETSAAGSRESLSTLNWHEWNSCPSRYFSRESFRFGKGRRSIQLNA
jgi:hypothetical protein